MNCSSCTLKTWLSVPKNVVDQTSSSSSLLIEDTVPGLITWKEQDLGKKGKGLALLHTGVRVESISIVGSKLLCFQESVAKVAQSCEARIWAL